MIKLIIFDLWQTLAYRAVKYSTTSEMLKKTKANIPKDKFIKIFENSIQTKKWKSKFEAYKNLCKNMGLETTEIKRTSSIKNAGGKHTNNCESKKMRCKNVKKAKKRGAVLLW